MLSRAPPTPQLCPPAVPGDRGATLDPRQAMGLRKERSLWGREPADLGFLVGVRGDNPPPEQIDHTHEAPLYKMPRPWRLWSDEGEEEELGATCSIACSIAYSVRPSRFGTDQ